MKNYTLLFIGALLLLSLSCNRKDSLITFESKTVKLQFDKTGELKAIIDKEKGKNYLPKGEKSFLLSIRITGDYENPVAMEIKDGKILLKYPSNIIATLKIEEKDTYLTFELVKIEGDSEVELVVWGPYPTSINKTIGETVGVVRGDDFAIGLQALNIKTIGGYPWKENDCMPQIDIFEQNDFNDLSEKDKRYVLYRVEAAKPEDFGSTLQAYCRNRNKDRIIENLNHTKYVAPAYNDGGIIGSKIAIFGCPVDKALETIGSIEVNEGLPHPAIDGRWGKISPGASAAYLIMGFGEEDIEKALEITKKAGLRYLYHPGPFSTWGHFQLNKQFPHGREGLKQCVEKAKKEGIMLGVHTLSNFITTNDPYVTPVPDPRLMRTGSSRIMSAIDADSTEIIVADPTPFRDQGTLSTAIIEDALVQYRALSDSEPWTLSGCKRGAFGTKAIAHAQNADIGKLIDHPYRVFFPDLEMQDEMADRLVELFNQTGLRQISFDGLEGCERTGYGIYAHNRFVKRCFDGWNMEVVNDASRLLHYLWHIHTRMNWGEPWGKSTREGMPEYRFKNQAFFERNLFPRMLGWFQLRLASKDIEATSIGDIEWVLSKCAGFDAGFALSTSLGELEKNGQSENILKAVKDWENARLSGAFSADQRQRLRKSNAEFHLESLDDGTWNLYPVMYSSVFSYTGEERQPGEPLGTEWEFANEFARQPLKFVLRVLPEIGASQETAVANPTFEVGFDQVVFPVEIYPYQYLVCDGDGAVAVYDMNWNVVQAVEIDGQLPEIGHGVQRIRFLCDEPLLHHVEVKFKLVGAAEVVRSGQ